MGVRGKTRPTPWGINWVLKVTWVLKYLSVTVEYQVRWINSSNETKKFVFGKLHLFYVITHHHQEMKGGKVDHEPTQQTRSGGPFRWGHCAWAEHGWRRVEEHASVSTVHGPNTADKEWGPCQCGHCAWTEHGRQRVGAHANVGTVHGPNTADKEWGTMPMWALCMDRLLVIRSTRDPLRMICQKSFMS